MTIVLIYSTRGIEWLNTIQCDSNIDRGKNKVCQRHFNTDSFSEQGCLKRSAIPNLTMSSDESIENPLTTANANGDINMPCTSRGPNDQLTQDKYFLKKKTTILIDNWKDYNPKRKRNLPSIYSISYVIVSWSQMWAQLRKLKRRTAIFPKVWKLYAPNCTFSRKRDTKHFVRSCGYHLARHFAEIWRI